MLLQEDPTSELMVESPVPVSLEGPPGHVNILETSLSSATSDPDATLIRTGRFRASSGPRPPLTATEGLFHKEFFLCLYCASPEHFLCSCPLCRPKSGESLAQPSPKVGSKVLPVSPKRGPQVLSAESKEGPQVLFSSSIKERHVLSAHPNKGLRVLSAGRKEGPQVLPVSPFIEAFGAIHVGTLQGAM